MTECHDFWFWFTRPFAEFLGAMALFAGLLLAALIGVIIVDIAKGWKRP